jgi:hypothetical protein
VYGRFTENKIMLLFFNPNINGCCRDLLPQAFKRRAAGPELPKIPGNSARMNLHPEGKKGVRTDKGGYVNPLREIFCYS